MVLIQVVAAVLLLAGTALILRALVEIEAPTRPRLVVRAARRALRDEQENSLSRAA